jgi:N utilization substance protein B
MSARTKARKRALDVLFESELRADTELGSTLTARSDAAEPALNPYTVRLVEGVVEHQQEIDRLLTEYAVGWTLDRMPAVDRNLLRLAVFEILCLDDVPDVVAVSEAVALATSLSTEQSPTFVNGLLARIVTEKAHLTV